jgi:hypothetical protein
MSDDERRELVKRLNEKTADLFDTRPMDYREFYKEQYASVGLKWPALAPDERAENRKKCDLLQRVKEQMER